jgi:hypothetical protein
MTRDNNLTVCSVSFNSQDYLQLNWQLTQELNNQQNCQWIIAENTPNWSASNKYEIAGDRCLIIEGAVPDPNLAPSYHHADALNKVLGFVKTRFLLILDPDFYIVRPNWIEGITQYMISQDLSFFGVPWNPKWYTKYRYFPCVHCLFIDLNKVPLKDINFTPNLLVSKEIKDSKKESMKEIIKGKPPYLRDLAKTISRLLQMSRRISIGLSHDTGHRLFEQYVDRLEFKRECVVPVFCPKTEVIYPELSTWFNQIYELFLPDSLCFIPKQKGYYTESGFRDRGYPDLRALGWEEFFWQGEPFGFHLRSQRQDQAEIEARKVTLEQSLKVFTAKIN